MAEDQAPGTSLKRPGSRGGTAGGKRRKGPRQSVLSDGVYDQIKRLVLEHEVPPGARLSIDGLARRLGVSQTPVREALARLEADGLVVKRPLAGYSTTPVLDERGFEELYDMRMLLEPFAASRAAGRATADDLAEMSHEIPALDDRIDWREDPAEFSARDARFHNVILRAAGNQTLLETMERLRPHLQIYPLYVWVGIARETVEEHQMILTAIRDRDPVAAGEAMRVHIERSRQRLSEAIYVAGEAGRPVPGKDAEGPSET